MPVVRPETGGAVKSHKNFVKDHVIARRLELDFNWQLVPAHSTSMNDRVIAELESVGIDCARLREAQHQTVRGPSPSLDRDYQQAVRVGSDHKKIEQLVFETWISTRDLNVFCKSLDAAGLTLASGRKTVQVVDRRTGAYFDLARLLRRNAKRRGSDLRVRQQDFAALDLHDLDTARDAGLANSLHDARIAADREHEFLLRETAIDQGDAAAIQTDAQLKAARLPSPDRNTLAARRSAILFEQRHRDKLRQSRVDRAFRHANWFDHEAVRKFAFMAAAAGIALAGGGLGLAVLAGGFAAHMVPTRERARMLARRTHLQRTGEWSAVREKLDNLLANDMQHASIDQLLDGAARMNDADQMASISGATGRNRTSTLQPPDPPLDSARMAAGTQNKATPAPEITKQPPTTKTAGPQRRPLPRRDGGRDR